MYIQFEWDENKAGINRKKHGVGFEEAQSVFYDDHALEFEDPDPWRQEERCLMLGVSVHLRVLVVSYCLRRGCSIRIISARKATKKETLYYEEMHP